MEVHPVGSAQCRSVFLRSYYARSRASGMRMQRRSAPLTAHDKDTLCGGDVGTVFADVAMQARAVSGFQVPFMTALLKRRITPCCPR
jgi:hypothetical protein